MRRTLWVGKFESLKFYLEFLQIFCEPKPRRTFGSQSPVRKSAQHSTYLSLCTPLCAHSALTHASRYVPGARASPQACCVSYLVSFRQGLQSIALSRDLLILFRGRHVASSMFGFSCTKQHACARYFCCSICEHIGSSPGAPLLWAECSPT
jgi:hypothetical protein